MAPHDADEENGRTVAAASAALQDAAERQRHYLAQARLHVDQAIYLFQSIIERIRAGEDVPRKDAEQSVQALLAAVQTFFTIRMRLDDGSIQHPGDAEEADLDLEHARSKVGRLLDRLRAAEGPG